MADTPGLEPGAVRLGGSSPPSRTLRYALLSLQLILGLSGCSRHIPQSPPLIPKSELAALLSTPKLHQRYLALESKFASEQLASLVHVQRDLLQRHLEKSNESAVSNADRAEIGGYRYDLETLPGDIIASIFRSDKNQRRAIFVNPNDCPKVGVSPVLSAFRISPDEQSALILLGDENGTTAFISRNGSCQALPFHSVYDGVWARQDSVVISVSENLRAARVFLVTLYGPSPKSREILYEPNPTFALSLHRAVDGSLVIIEAHAPNVSKVYALSTSLKEPRPNRLFLSGQPALLRADHYGSSFFVSKNSAHEPPALLAIKDSLSHVLWRGTDQEILSDFKVFSNAIALYVAQGSRSRIVVITPQGTERDKFECTRFPCTLTPLPTSANDQIFRFTISQPFLPSRDASYNLLTHTFDAGTQGESPYRVQQFLAPAEDGILIPLIMAFPKRGTHPYPTLLYAYGAYGKRVPLTFFERHRFLLEHGIAIGFVEPRGGGFYGEHWHRLGVRENKLRSIDDFIAATRYIKERGLSGLTVASGRSAGGMLVLSAAHKAPDLFRAVEAAAPLIDVLAAVSDPKKPLFMRERQEWGNPDVTREHAAILEYSPATLPVTDHFPSLYLSSSRDDMVTGASEATPFIIRLRRVIHDQRKVLYDPSEGAHTGTSLRALEAREEARRDAFIIGVLSGTLP